MHFSFDEEEELVVKYLLSVELVECESCSVSFQGLGKCQDERIVK